MILRPATAADAAAIARIYAHEVLHGIATAEEVPPDTDEIARRMAETINTDHSMGAVQLVNDLT